MRRVAVVVLLEVTNPDITDEQLASVTVLAPLGTHRIKQRVDPHWRALFPYESMQTHRAQEPPKVVTLYMVQYLVHCGLARTKNHARRLMLAGQVRLDTQPLRWPDDAYSVVIGSQLVVGTRTWTVTEESVR